MELRVDRERCLSAGMCALTAPDVFDQDAEDGRCCSSTPHRNRAGGGQPPERPPRCARPGRSRWSKAPERRVLVRRRAGDGGGRQVGAGSVAGQDSVRITSRT